METKSTFLARNAAAGFGVWQPAKPSPVLPMPCGGGNLDLDTPATRWRPDKIASLG
jgi:hypothetical protein